MLIGVDGPARLDDGSTARPPISFFCPFCPIPLPPAALWAARVPYLTPPSHPTQTYPFWRARARACNTSAPPRHGKATPGRRRRPPPAHLFARPRRAPAPSVLVPVCPCPAPPGAPYSVWHTPQPAPSLLRPSPETGLCAAPPSACLPPPCRPRGLFCVPRVRPVFAPPPVCCDARHHHTRAPARAHPTPPRAAPSHTQHCPPPARGGCTPPGRCDRRPLRQHTPDTTPPHCASGGKAAPRRACERERPLPFEAPPAIRGVSSRDSSSAAPAASVHVCKEVLRHGGVGGGGL